MKGWSLLELMAALAAFVPMMLGLLALFMGAMKVFVAGTNTIEALQGDRAAIDVMGQHLRSAVYFDNAVPVDDGDVGMGNGREAFRFLGLDDAVNGNDFLGWYAHVYHTDEDDANGGEVQYIQANAARYNPAVSVPKGGGPREIFFLQTGDDDAGNPLKSQDNRPYPSSASHTTGALPPSSPANPFTVTTLNNMLLDGIVLLDFDYADDTSSPSSWQQTWDSNSKKRLPAYVRMTVRVQSVLGGGGSSDSVPLSTIFHLPLYADTSPWPNGIRP